MLEQEGLAVTIPRKGAEVAKMTEKDMEDVLQIRDALDELAASIACEQMTKEQLDILTETMHEFEESTKSKDLKKIAAADVQFHDIIYQATGNPKLVNMLNNLREQMYRYRLEYVKDARTHSIIISEHNDIIKQIRDKNVPVAKTVIHQHISNQEKGISRLLNH